MSLLHVCLLPALLASAALYDPSRTSVHILNNFNFDKQVSKQRTKLAAIVHFYRENDTKSRHFVEELNTLAKDWQGAFVIGSVNCDTQESLCETQDIRTVPMVKVYPPLPSPIYEYEGEKTAKKLISKLANYLNPKVTELFNDSIKAFLEARPGTPKILLFTERSETPTIYRALSNVLSETLDFGIIRKEESSLVSQYKITSFPKLLLIKSDGKVQPYEGEMKYRPIFEFLNIYSEVFVVGEATNSGSSSGSSSGGSSSAQPTQKVWRNDPVPELTASTADEICTEGLICAVYITNVKLNIDQNELFKSLRGKFDSQIAGRGLNVAFMWVDSKENRKFLDVFENVSAPALVYVLQKNRFVKHTGSLTQASIEAAIGKIAGGDAKFLPIKGKFPQFGKS